MGGLGELWLHLVVSPLTTGLAYLFSVTGSAVLGIVLFTIITRLVLLPLGIMQVRSQKKMMALQPELKAIQKRYAKEPEKRAQEQMRLYKENGVNPALGCLPLVAQMPILFGLYAGMLNLAYFADPNYGQYLTEFQKSVAPLLQQPFLYLCSLVGPDGIPMGPNGPMSCAGGNPFDPSAFFSIAGFQIPGPMLLVMTALSYVVQKMMVMPTADPQQQQMNKMMAFMPLMYLFFFSTVPAGLVVYWLVTNVFSIAQQYFIMGPGSLLPKSEPAATTSLAKSVVEEMPEENGAGGQSASDRRPAARSGKRRKSGRR
jgi:YidC/Oxa1 family membrane protein insertase